MADPASAPALAAAPAGLQAATDEKHGDAMTTARAERLRATLTAYYATHNTEEISKVEALVARVVGGPPGEVGGMVIGGVLWSEDELFEKVEAKYGAKVEPA
eukprot:SAG22_NODE_2083_length_3036_cov_7.310861_4_plen_102_part_00